MILLIDNYDSFTYNLFQYLSELGERVSVARNDKITIEEIEKMKPQRIIISPAPPRMPASPTRSSSTSGLPCLSSAFAWGTSASGIVTVVLSPEPSRLCTA